MSLLAAALLFYAGMAALCLSLRKHWQTALASERDPPRVLLAAIACTAISVSVSLLADAYGWPIAITLAFGLASVCAGAVVLTATYQPLRLIALACAAGVLAMGVLPLSGAE